MLIGVGIILVSLLGLVLIIPPYAAQSDGFWASMGSMMGPRMMGGIARGTEANLGGPRITFDEATQTAQRYLVSLANPDLAIDEIMEFQYNFYVIFNEKSTGIRAFEMLIDPYTGRIFPEFGPNMMWNTKYGMMSGMAGWGMMGGGGRMMGGMMGRDQRGSPTANMPVTRDQAVTITDDYLKRYLPDASTEEPDVFYGYYTLHILKDGKIYGMLSVNGYSGRVWYHDWHGEFVRMQELV